MEEVTQVPGKHGHIKFVILEGEDEIAEMETGLSGNILTIYHTEVSEAAEGRGLAKTLLAAMADYAKEKNYKVKPLCSFVHGQFKKYPERYAELKYNE